MSYGFSAIVIKKLRSISLIWPDELIVIELGDYKSMNWLSYSKCAFQFDSFLLINYKSNYFLACTFLYGYVCPNWTPLGPHQDPTLNGSNTGFPFSARKFATAPHENNESVADGPSVMELKKWFQNRLEKRHVRNDRLE